MPELAELLRRLSLDLVGLVTLLRRVAESDLLRGHVVSLTVAAGAASGSAPHGLGRGHQGAFVLTSTSPVAYAVATATDNLNVSLSVASAPVTAVTFRLWVY